MTALTYFWGYLGLFFALSALMVFLGPALEKRLKEQGPDGRSYKVFRGPRSRDAATRLARINARVAIVMERLRHSRSSEARRIHSILFARYGPDSLSEGPLVEGMTSYTIDKGKEMVYCLAPDRSGRKSYNDDLLFVIALHELAHVASMSPGHGTEFRDNYKILKETASAAGLLRPPKEKFEYCGLTVDPAAL